MIYGLLYDLVRGPLVWISFAVFIIGSIFQAKNMLALTIANDRVNAKENNILNRLKKFFKEISSFKTIALRLAMLKTTIIGVNPAMLIVTCIFHVCLIIAPVFLLAHNVLLDNAIGISFFSISEKTTDFLTILVIACSIYFLFRRIFVDRVRLITTLYDYIILFLAAAPFLTGFLAYHHIFKYNVVIILHIISGEIMLMAIPFTKFAHLLFFFIFRFLVGSEYSIGSSNRNWKNLGRV